MHFMWIFQIAALESKPIPSLDDIDMDDVDDDVASVSVKAESIDDVYRRYDFNRDLPDLPIVEQKSLILKAIEENSIIILEGATGCGKTTQVCFLNKSLWCDPEMRCNKNVSLGTPIYIG